MTKFVNCTLDVMALKKQLPYDRAFFVSVRNNGVYNIILTVCFKSEDIL